MRSAKHLGCLTEKAAQQEEARYRVGERAFSSAEANRSEMYRTDVGFTVSFDHGQQPGNVVEKEVTPNNLIDKKI